jgi:serine/threonine-protein kinase
VDPDIAQLVKEERLREAAALASARGDAHLASRLYERACDWASASTEALVAGDAVRALELAAEAGDEVVADRATAAVVVQPERTAAAVAARLAQRGHNRRAAIVLETVGRRLEAAPLWERAGDPLRAAALLEASGDPAGAARVLETAQRRTPDAWAVSTALGALLARFGKYEAAVRALQRVPAEAPERREALAHLVPALERLQLERAAADAAAELAACGGAPERDDRRRPDEPRATAVVTPRIFGRYDVVRDVASSPSARVLECIDIVRGERVAVKVFAAWDARSGTGRDALARFEREVRTMRALDHPSIVPMREYVPEGPAIVLGWMAGGTLEKILATAGALAPARAVEIAVAVLAALGEGHRLGILHRDVKPANVLFDEAGGAHLSDFGVAHLGDVSATATAGVFGTLAYMSPEQRAGRPATLRSDLFAVGVLLREMLTGERPVAERTPSVRPSDAHRQLSAQHDAAVLRLAMEDPAERPADAFEARSSLVSLAWPATVDATAVPARAERRASPGPRPGRLDVTSDGVVDTWTGRRVERVALGGAALARARAFALADHPGLQTVLRVDHDDSALWLEALPGPPLDRALTPAERSTLAGALAALHTAGGVHGRVDAAHVVVGESGARLRFEAHEDATATIDRDRLALSRL